jgi:hypothetical protein
MIRIDDDLETLHVTRGDTPQTQFNRLCFYFPIYNFETEEEENYKFQLDDEISFVVFNKKGYTKNEIFKLTWKISDLGYVEPSETPEIPLTEELMKKFPLSNKKQTYWYDIVLNDTTTILGMDEEGAKKIIVYPEAEEDE